MLRSKKAVAGKAKRTPAVSDHGSGSENDNDNTERQSDNSDGEEPPRRRITDVPVDDDDDWREEDTHLQGLGVTTLASRNRDKEVQPIRKRGKVVVQGANSKASNAAKREARSNKMAALQKDINAFIASREELALELAGTHNVKIEEVRRRLQVTSSLKPTRAVTAYNAKVVALLDRENEGV